MYYYTQKKNILDSWIGSIINTFITIEMQTVFQGINHSWLLLQSCQHVCGFRGFYDEKSATFKFCAAKLSIF